MNKSEEWMNGLAKLVMDVEHSELGMQGLLWARFALTKLIAFVECRAALIAAGYEKEKQ